MIDPRRHRTALRLAGFTVIEILISLSVLTIFFGAVTAIIQVILNTLGESRVRATAMEIAQQELEIINNLPYDSVGTEGGIPSGVINPQSTISRNGINYSITVSVIFVDDPFDGSSPADTVNTDYKKVRILVNWNGAYSSRLPISLVTQLAPKGKEDDLPGGTIEINVFNSIGQPVTNATVTIDNTLVSPEIHLTTLSDIDGKVILPGAAPCDTCYQINATKWGYSTDRTYGVEEVTNPILPHLTVADKSVAQISFVIDEVSTLTVKSYNTNYQAIGNVYFTARGNKIIGYDEFDSPVYKYAKTTNTGGSTVQLSALEWDTYNLTFESSSHTLAGSNPVLPISLAPKTNQTIAIVVVPESNASLLVIARDAFGNPLASASAQLISPAIGYDKTVITPESDKFDFGHAFFRSLTPETYELKVQMPGYQEATSAVTIDSNQIENIYLSEL
jgi:hypothetical protein